MSLNASCSPFLSFDLCFLGTEVPGGDRIGSVPHIIFLSRGTPRANIRAFLRVAQGRVLTFYRNMHPAHFAPTWWEEGLQSIKGQTFDHPSYQKRADRTAWQEDKHYASIILRSPSIIFRFHLEPLHIQTLLVVASIVTEKDLSEDDAHKMQDIFLALNDCFLYLCVCVECSKLC